MLKIIFIFFISIFFINVVCAQENFNLTIKLDSSIIPQNAHYKYYDGKSTIFLPDTFGNRRVIILKGQYYSPLVSFNIRYTDSEKNVYDNDFFINSKSATIYFHFKSNNENKLTYTSIKNATPIYDTTTNKIWQGLQAFMVDTAVTKENKAFDSFLEQNKNFASNDSLTRIFNEFYKTHLNRSALFLKKYPNDYFSFWYFIQQIAQTNGILSKDKDYLKEQLAYLKAVFPIKYTESIEGRELINDYEIAITPVKLHTTSPSFAITTIDGKKINLTGLKGKYVLLDFWATWCPPCMAEMPFIKDLRKSYSPEKLMIIGISQDVDLKKLNMVVKKESMNWPQFYDRNNEIRRLYGITGFPTLVLIDKEGSIIYKSDFVKNDQEALPKLLENIN